uniref:Uncharacterized protein n=1 Tax=Glossina palpalis gambiensis TaxID=67801 RepID=A0A1B0AKE9_9MUSC
FRSLCVSIGPWIYRPIIFVGNINHGGYEEVDANIAGVRNEMSAGVVAMKQGLKNMKASWHYKFERASIHSRICFDDHLIPTSYNLATICRVLLEKKIIKRFSLVIKTKNPQFLTTV